MYFSFSVISINFLAFSSGFRSFYLPFLLGSCGCFLWVMTLTGMGKTDAAPMSWYLSGRGCGERDIFLSVAVSNV